MIWEELNTDGLAPLMFCKMTKVTWEFYWYSMAAYRKFDFLLLCEGGEWKLRQWSIDSYSSWTRNIGLRPVKSNAETLNDPALIQMDPNDDLDNSKDNPPQGNDNDDDQCRTEERREASTQRVRPPSQQLITIFITELLRAMESSAAFDPNLVIVDPL
jgi:hypothetical protein